MAPDRPYSKSHMNRRRLSQTSLKITRRSDREPASRFIVEVWNPFASTYQVAVSVEDGLRRVGELSDLIGRMWLQRHPKRDLLVDVPDAAAIDGQRWAEFRVNASTFRSYDTRYDDRPDWTKAAGMVQAAATTCTSVGCALPVSAAP
jgi:hypothetical protein